MPENTRTTVIDRVEVFDDRGNMSLMINNWDVLHLRKIDNIPGPDGEQPPTLTDLEHEQIILAIVKALGLNEEIGD